VNTRAQRILSPASFCRSQASVASRSTGHCPNSYLFPLMRRAVPRCLEGRNHCPKMMHLYFSPKVLNFPWSPQRHWPSRITASRSHQPSIPGAYFKACIPCSFFRPFFEAAGTPTQSARRGPGTPPRGLIAPALMFLSLRRLWWLRSRRPTPFRRCR